MSSYTPVSSGGSYKLFPCLDYIIDKLIVGVVKENQYSKLCFTSAIIRSWWKQSATLMQEIENAIVWAISFSFLLLESCLRYLFFSMYLFIALCLSM